jgi:hypothetical protein
MNIRFNNLDEFDFGNNDYIIAQGELFNYVEAKIKHKIMYDKYRLSALIKFGTNILYLNPGITIEQLIKLLFVQRYKFHTNLPMTEITKIGVYLHKKHVEGTLVHNNKGRRILFNPKSSLNGKDKRVITLNVVSQLKKKETISKISNLIQNWNYDVYGKCTGVKIVELTNISKKTVLLHLKHYRDIINEINKEKKKSTSMNIVNLIQRTTLFLNEKNTSTEKKHIQRTTPFLNENKHIQRTTVFSDNINYKEMGENNESVPLQCNSTVEDTSIYDNFNLSNLQDIEKFIFDFNIKLHSSLKPKDFINNLNYQAKSNYEKAKILLNSNI